MKPTLYRRSTTLKQVRSFQPEWANVINFNLTVDIKAKMSQLTDNYI